MRTIMKALPTAAIAAAALAAVAAGSARAGDAVPAGVDTHMKAGGRVANDDWQSMAKPQVDGIFLRPQAVANAQPLWGFKDGLQVGLYPLRGPRGLLRIFLPELGLPEGKVVNFIAIEPSVKDKKGRGLSELEKSPLDQNEPGLRFWASDTLEDSKPKLPEDHPARGVVAKNGEIQTLTVYVQVENYANGAKLAVRLTFRSDRTREVGVATFKRPGCVDLDACVVTSTMGNYARLRELHLKDAIVRAGDLWPQFTTDSFAPHREFGLDKLPRLPDGSALICATTNEKEPEKITDGFPAKAWIYSGKVATQYWRVEKPAPALNVQVNGRYTYYGSKSPVPGGIAFENFEMTEPYRDGAEFWFGVTQQSVVDLLRPSGPASTTPPAPADPATPAARRAPVAQPQPNAVP